MIYKVRDKITGLFVQRGYRTYLSKNGTVWKRKSDLKASINNHLFKKIEIRFPNQKIELEVVEFELIEKNTINLENW